MEFAVFAKRAQTKEGKVFYNYLTTLINNKTNEQVTVRVKFRDSCGAPKPESCPRNIVVDKRNANMTTKEIHKDDGSVILTRTMWVSAWDDGSAYVDHSMDDFE